METNSPKKWTLITILKVAKNDQNCSQSGLIDNEIETLKDGVDQN